MCVCVLCTKAITMNNSSQPPRLSLTINASAIRHSPVHHKPISILSAGRALRHGAARRSRTPDWPGPSGRWFRSALGPAVMSPVEPISGRGARLRLRGADRGGANGFEWVKKERRWRRTGGRGRRWVTVEMIDDWLCLKAGVLRCSPG